MTSSARADAVRAVGAQAVATVLGALAGIFLARAIGPSGKGVIAVLQATCQLAVQGFGFSLPMAVAFFTANRQMSLGAIVASAQLLSVAGLAALVGVGYAVECLRLTTAVLPPGFEGWRGYVVAWFVPAAAVAVLMGVAQGKKDLLPLNVAVVAASSAQLLLFAGVFFGVRSGMREAWGVRTILIGLLVLQWLQLLAWVWVHRLRIGSWPLPIWRSALLGCRRIVGFAALAHASNLAQFLNHRLDLWIVSYLWGTRHVGLYSTAVGIAQLLLLASHPLAMVLLPHFVARSPVARDGLLAEAVRQTATLGILLALVLAALGSQIIGVLYGPQFSDAAPALGVLLPGVAASMVTRILSTYVAARGQVAHNLIASCVGLVGTVCLDLLLIPRYGIIGAATATTVSYWLTCAYCIWAVTVKLGVRLDWRPRLGFRNIKSFFTAFPGPPPKPDGDDL